MNYPTAQAYSDALQMAQISLLDSVLQSGRVEADGWGLPFGRTGSFAITFKVFAGGGSYAFRCFLQNRATIHERYDAISAHLTNAPLPYFVDFHYLDAGIRVDGNNYPTVRMGWAAGTPLGIYIQNNYTDTKRMKALQAQVQAMATALEEAGVAHGDIQGGNLLVDDSGHVTLVDYDGMYVPSIAALGAIETGHPNFQHPLRREQKPFDAHVDRFAFAVLHTTIGALIERPSLWNQLSGDPDKILLGEKDFLHPFNSSAFAALCALPNLGAFATSLQSIASAPYAQIPSFSDFLTHSNIPTGSRSRRSAGAPSTGSSAPWYAEHTRSSNDPQSSSASLGDYAGTDPVIDAANPDHWAQSRPWDVELIGKVRAVDVGETGKNLPYARLIMNDGDPQLTVDVWAEGIRRFAEQGVTVDDSWAGQWISAKGAVQGPIGFSGGTRFSLSVVRPSRLERLNAQQARWRLTTNETPTGNSAPSASSNSAALGDLSNAAKKPSPAATAAAPMSPKSSPPSYPPSSPVVPAKGGGNAVFATIALVVGIVIAFLIAALVAGGVLLAGSGEPSQVATAGQSAGEEDSDEPAALDDEPVQDPKYELYVDDKNGKPIRWDRCKGPIYVSVDYGDLRQTDQQFVYSRLISALANISLATDTNYVFAEEVQGTGSVEQNRSVSRKAADALIVSFDDPVGASEEWAAAVAEYGSVSGFWYDLGSDNWDWNYIKQAAIQINPAALDSQLEQRLMVDLAIASGLKALPGYTTGELMGGDWSSNEYGPGDRAGLKLLGDKPCD